MHTFANEYHLKETNGIAYLSWRKWLDSEEYAKGITSEEASKILTEVIMEEKPKVDTLKFVGLEKVIKGNKQFNNLVQKFPKFNSVDVLPNYTDLKEIDLDNYNKINNYITKFNHNKKGTKSINVHIYSEDKLLFLFKSVDNKKNKTINCVLDKVTWESDIEMWDSDKFPYLKWIDINNEEEKCEFTRVIGEYKLFIVNGEISYLERSYDFPDIRFATREEKRNTKIGAIDLETYALNS